MKHLVLFPLALLALTLPALADTATAVNVAPLLSSLINDFGLPLVGMLTLAALGWLTALAKKRLGISIDQALVQQVDDFALKQAGIVLAKLVNAKEFNIDVKNPVIAQAAAAAELQIPSVLKSLGVTPAAVESYVGDFIVKHLGIALAGEPDVPTPAGAIPGTNVTADGVTVPAAA